MTGQHSNSSSSSTRTTGSTYASAVANITNGTEAAVQLKDRRSNDAANPQQGASSRNGSTSRGTQQVNSNNHTTTTTTSASSNNENSRGAPVDSIVDNGPEAATNGSSSNAAAGCGSVSVPAASASQNSNVTSTGVGDVVPPPPPPLRPSIKIPPTHKDERKLFVGGLPADITNEEFRLFFDQFGVVIDSIVMFDYETQRSRGFGFVTFEDPAVSRYLLSRGYHDDNTMPPEVVQQHAQNPTSGRMKMRDKWIEIKAAQPKAGGGGRSNRNRNSGLRAQQPVRLQQEQQQRGTTAFIPPPPHQADVQQTSVGNPYTGSPTTIGAAVPSEYGAVANGTPTNSHPASGSMAQHAQVPVFHQQYYAQHPPPHSYPPYYYAAPGAHGGYSAHYYPAGGVVDPAVAHMVPASAPFLDAAVPIMQQPSMVAGSGPVAVGSGAPPGIYHQVGHPAVVSYGYYYHPAPASAGVPTANPAVVYGGIAAVPLPSPPHGAALPAGATPSTTVMQQSAMQPVAPGIPNSNSFVEQSSSKEENPPASGATTPTNHKSQTPSPHPNA